MIRRTLLALSISAALSGAAFAQQTPPEAPPIADVNVPLSYVGSNGRIGLGINEHGDVQGEALGIFGYDGTQAWLGQFWLGQGGAGGVQLDYHWLWAGKTRDDTIAAPDSVTVAKAFVAADQNLWRDRKLTLGAGFEKQNYFLDAYLMGALTGRRLVGSATDVLTSTLTGSDSTGPFTQTQTTTTITDFFDRPYNYGAGLHAGKFFEEPLIRLRAGLDYEVGRDNADQIALSLGAEKLFRNSGFSIALQAEHIKKSGPFESDKSDDRGWLLLRYEFGQNFRPTDSYKMVQVDKPAPAVDRSPPPSTQPQVMRNEARLDSDAFFDFDRSALRAETVAQLDEVLAKLKSGARISRVSVVGHTCNIGSADYNQRLSERRANSVRDYLIAHGIASDEIQARGEGLRNPQFPNDSKGSRQKNRRVDIDFLTIEETVVAPPPVPPLPPVKSAVEWIKEPIAMPAPWIERALRNPAEHKRTVDVYKIEKSTTNTTLGPKVYVNRPPVAQNDASTVPFNSSNNAINVLANDSDPDGNPLTVTSVTAPAHGGATILANALSYTPTTGYQGTDTFNYSISDGHGGTASASVTITVSAGSGNRPPIAVDDLATTIGTTPVTINVIANDSDPDGDSFKPESVSAPGHGSARLNNDDTVTYVANAGFVGTDTFTYLIEDSRGGQATARVTVSVTATANRAPIAANDQFVLPKGSTDNYNVLANDNDPDGDPLTVISVVHTGVLTSDVSINPDNTIHYVHHHGTQGRDTFDYTITDGQGNTATATVAVDVIPIGG